MLCNALGAIGDFLYNSFIMHIPGLNAVLDTIFEFVWGQLGCV